MPRSCDVDACMHCTHGCRGARTRRIPCSLLLQLPVLRVVLGFATAGAAAATSRLLRGVPVLQSVHVQPRHNLRGVHACMMHAAKMAHIGMRMHAVHAAMAGQQTAASIVHMHTYSGHMRCSTQIVKVLAP